MKFYNRYYILRHGESLSNVKDIMSCWPEKGRFPLTRKGKKQAKAAAEKLKNKNINLIFSSDLLRTKETAGIAAKELNLKVKYDKRLREVNVGIFNGKPIADFRKFFPVKDIEKRFKIKPKGGETYSQVRKRMREFLKNLNKNYKDKNILIVSHQLPLTLLEAEYKGIADERVFKEFPKKKKISTGEIRLL